MVSARGVAVKAPLAGGSATRAVREAAPQEPPPAAQAAPAFAFRAREKRQLGSKYEKRKEAQETRREHLDANQQPVSDLASTFRDDDEI